MKISLKTIFKTILPISIISIFITTTISCDEDVKPEPETTFYRININDVEEITEESKVIIRFKLTDDQNIGVKGKTDSDFDLYEQVIGENEDLSDPLEARRYINPDPNSFAYATMIVMDLSGSVIEDIDYIKSASLNYVDNLYSNINSGNLLIGVYYFDGRTELQQLIPFSDSLTDVKQAIESMDSSFQQNPQTALYHAVSDSCELMKNQLQSFQNNEELALWASSIVVFSDGKNSNFIGITKNDMINKIQELSYLKTQFYCIAAGGDIDNNVVDSIGNNGVFTISGYSKLNEGLNNVLDIITREANSNYELEFCTAKRGANVRFRLEVKEDVETSQGAGNFDTTGFAEGNQCVLSNN